MTNKKRLAPPRPPHLAILLLCLLAQVRPAAAAIAHAWRLDQDSAALARTADSLGAAGFRPISLDAYGDSARPVYASAWARRAGPPWALVQGLSGAALADSLRALALQGWGPALVTATHGAAGWAAVVERDSTPATLARDLDRHLFRQACDSAQRAGLRPAWVDAYGTRQRPLFACLWRKNREGIPWNYSLGDSPASQKEKAATFAAVWVRPALVVPMPDGRLFTLWQEGSVGAWSLDTDLPEADCRAALVAAAASGRHPLSLSVSGPGAGKDPVFALLAAEHDTPLPRTWTATGPESPGLEEFDAYVRRLMQAQQVRAGALAMVKDGRLVLARGYTWGEAGYPITQPGSLFRVASCSKPLTSMVFHKLWRQGDAGPPLSLGDKVLGRLLPAGAAPSDARFADVTVDDLLSHSGGWIRSRENPDPVFNDFPAGHAIRRRLPAAAKDFLAYMLGQPLQFAPGTRSAYANFGYFLLGRIIETMPGNLGRSYEQVAADALFRPLGLSRPRFGGSLLGDRAAGEVLYHTRYPYLGNGPSGGPAWVPGGYGDFDLRNMDAAGAWILSAADYAKVLASFDLGEANPVLDGEAVRTMWTPPHEPRFLRGWFSSRVRKGDDAVAKWHNGMFPGTSALIYYRPDKWSFALFLNRDIKPQLSGDAEGRALGRIADGITAWPEQDLFPEMGIRSFAKGSSEGVAGISRPSHYSIRIP